MPGSWYYITVHISLQRIENYFTNDTHSLPNHFRAIADRDKLNQQKELSEDMQLVENWSCVWSDLAMPLKNNYDCMVWSTKQCRGDQRKLWLKFCKFCKKFCIVLYIARQETSLPQNYYKVHYLVSKVSSEKKTWWVNFKRFTICIPE